MLQKYNFLLNKKFGTAIECSFTSLIFKYKIMKKITLVLAFIGMISLNSCTINDVQDTVDYDTIAEVFEVTTSFSSGNNYSRIVSFNPPIYNSDAVLVYHLYDVVNGSDVWRLMPQTYYFDNGVELDYNFDFTTFDVNLFLDSNVNLSSFSSAWLQNQTFRIVVVPGYFAKGVAPIDYNDYDATINAFGYNDAKIINLK